MTALETVAAQRDAMTMKNRQLCKDLEAANAEIARLKGAPPVPSVPTAGNVPAPEVPVTGLGTVPPTGKKRFGLGGIR